MTEPSSDSPALARRLTLPLLVLYGLGTIVGAGIYALIGAVAARAGAHAPLSFVVAAALVSCTALTFAELSSRLPFAAGEAVYVREGLRAPRLGVLVALIVAGAGCVSAATITNAFVGYLDVLVDVPRSIAIVGFVALLAAVAAWGITESVTAASILTIVEASGLVLVIAVGQWAVDDWSSAAEALRPPGDLAPWSGIFAGALLAFYAFIGFEDMVNVAEEVTNVERTLPLAIIVVLVVTTVLYVALTLVAVAIVPPAELATSDAPLALVYTRATGRDATVLGVIGVLAMLNGALVQIIMFSRILYGLAQQGSLPAAFGRVHPVTLTPVLATATAAAVVAVLALAFPLTVLARFTSTLMLVGFTIVNAALFRLKRRDPHPPGVRVFPAWVPAVGFCVSLVFLIYGVRNLLVG